MYTNITIIYYSHDVAVGRSRSVGFVIRDDDARRAPEQVGWPTVEVESDTNPKIKRVNWNAREWGND